MTFDDYDTQVQCEEMSFDMFTPEERLELAHALKDALRLRERSLPFTTT